MEMVPGIFKGWPRPGKCEHDGCGVPITRTGPANRFCREHAAARQLISKRKTWAKRTERLRKKRGET